MIRLKRGLAILLSTCLIGGMMPLPVSAEGTVSGNEVQSESTTEQDGNTGEQEETVTGQDHANEQPGTEEQPIETETIAAIQELIDTLPETDSITEDNVEAVTEQLDAIDEAKTALSDEELSQLDLTRYDAVIEKVMALLGMDGAGVAMLADTNTSPQYYTMQPGSTLDVTTVPMGELTPQVYQLNQNGATYTITGNRATTSSTTLRFVISADCTVILKDTEFKAGITYDDGTKTGYQGGTHGVFEVEPAKTAVFQLEGNNYIYPKVYNNGISKSCLPGILLKEDARVEFCGSGTLEIDGTIGKKIEIGNGNPGMYGGPGIVIMKSGSVSIDGFGSTYNLKNYNTPKGTVRFTYEGGNFRNTYDFQEQYQYMHTAPNEKSTMYRVEIPTGRSVKGKIKVGSTGTFSEFKAWSNGVLYAWQDSAATRDYYVICDGKYCHYKSGTYAAGTYTVQAVDAASEKDTIGGFSGKVRGSGKGIANAELTFVREDTDGIAYTGTCTTDSTGQYYVALPPGTYTVKLKFPTGELTYGEKFSLSEEKESNKDINVGAVSGTITDQKSNPLSGAWVTVQQGNNVFSTQTDDAGTYTIVPLGFTETSFDIRVAYKTFKAVSGTLTWNHSSGSTWNSSIDTLQSASEIPIASEADLLQLAKNVTELSGKTIILENDIVVSSGENGFKGIDYTNTGISNLTFQGNGHSISGMTRPLFHTDIDTETSGDAQMLNNCVFEDLHLRGEITIPGLSQQYYGALCGALSGEDSRIDGCSFEGSISYVGSTNGYCLGGLVGLLSDRAKIRNSCVKLNSLKTDKKILSIGGICGFIVDAFIQNCYTIVEEMEWTDERKVGVITGTNNNGSANNCYGIIKKATNNIKLCGDGSAENSYLSGNGANTSASGYITMEKVVAASGTDGALVDLLNNYANNISSFKKWALTANGYPEFQSLNDVNAADVTVTYDGSPHSIEVNGVPEGATITYSTDGKTYGSNKPSVTDVTAGTTIYYRVQLDTKEKTGSAKVIIEPVEIGITWGMTTFDYDGNVHIPTATATGMVNGDTLELTVATDSGNAIDAGTYTAKVTGITGTKAGNYKLSLNVTQSYTIAPVSLSSAGIAITGADTLTYNGKEQTPGITVMLGDKTLTANKDYTVSYANNINATTDTSKATATITGTNNYTGTASAEFVIKKAALTVTAEDKTIKYGEEPQFTAIYQGFVNGETETTTGALNGTLTFACDYVKAGSADNSKVGTYTIKPSGLTSANYDISFANGTLTVEQADGQVTIDAIGEKTFGDADFVLSVDKHGSDGALTYTSSAEDVLEVDNTGKVTLKKAGTARITVSMAADTNHTAATHGIDITVVRKAATLQVTSIEYTAVYGDSDIDLGLTTEGESTVTYTTTDDSVATAADGKLHIVGAGDAKISLSMAESTNYLAANVTISVKVNPAALTVTADNKSTDYGTDAPAFTVKYDGFKNGDTADTAGVLTGTLDFDCNYQNGDATNGKAGTYDIVPKGLTAGNYTITFVKGTLSVGKVESSVSIENVAAKTYGDAAFDLAVTKSGSTATPTYTSSDTSVLTVDTTGKVTIKGAGTATVTVTLPQDDNYNQAAASVSIIVNKKALTVTAENQNITYGDEAPAYSVVYDGFVNGETQDTTGVFDGTLTFSCDYRKADTTENNNSNAGTYSITPSGLTSANYEISFAEGTLTVGKAAGQVSIASVGAKTYGDADFALTVDKHGSEGALTFASSDTNVLTVDENGRVTLKNAGTATITVSMAADTNHTAATHGIDITVARKAATLQVTSLTYTAVYGDPDIDLGLTTEGESTVTYATTDDSVATAADGKLHIVGVGDATITLSMEQSTNYLAKDVDITVTVHPAALTVTADNKSTDYATDAPAFTVKYDGFKNGDTANTEGVLTGTLDFDCNYQKGDATNGKAGTYDIIPKGLTAKNYEITFGKGTLTVKKVASDILIESVAAKTYGDAAFDLAVTKSGSTATPTYTSSDTSVLTVDATGKVTIKGAGTATVTVALPQDDNYNQAEDSVSIIVNKKTLTVTAENKNITYGDEAPTYSVVYDGFVNGETQDTTGVLDGTLTFSCDYRKADTTGNTNSNAGTYSITPGGLTSTNYEISFVNGTLTVDKAAGQITIAAVGSKTYGDAEFVLTVDKHGSDGALTFASSDTNVLTVDENGRVTLKNAGTTTVAVTMAEGTNYKASADTIALTVKKASVAPNKPGTTMAPAHSTEKVGNIALPEGWSWQDTDKATTLADGVAVTATAVYTGADKGNYETESVSITITRSKCEHKHTEIRNQKTATCTQAGYTGDTYCTDCKVLLEIGRELATLGHDYKGTVTKQPTTTEEGVMTYTCSRCGLSYTESIAKLKAEDSNKDNGNQNPKPDTKPLVEVKQTPAVKPVIEVNPFTESKPYLKDDSGKEGWDVIRSQLDDAGTGDTVTVAMNGTTVVPKNVIDSIQGEDITLVLDMGDGISWKINGQDITGAAGDIDFGVTIGANAGKTIPVDVINNVTGERYSMNLTLAYDGEFGFIATLTVNMGARNAGLYANLFYYNVQTGELEFVSAGQIDAEGNADLAFTHASDYTIVIDAAVMNGGNDESVTSVENTEAAEEETVPATNEENQKDVSTWNSTMIFIIGICILAIVFGAVIYMRKKSGSEEE